MNKVIIGLLSMMIIIMSCQSASEKSIEKKESDKLKYPTIGKLIMLDPEFRNIIEEETEIEVLAEGFEWTEGPLWVEDGGYLLFSDIPVNSIFKWKEGEGRSLYLKPSGYTGEKRRKGEPGSNGLLLNDNGELVLCQHGDRRIAKMEAPLDKPAAAFTTIGDKYGDLRFNSPNDAVYHSNGDIYLTDPPYGLEKNMEDPGKEITFQGVYRLSRDGTSKLITKDLSRPNGIAFTKDERTLYVANSDHGNPVIMKYPVDKLGNVGTGTVFFDCKHLMGDGVKGLPDGLKVSKSGNVFATGPGGVLILSKDGKHLGTISSGEATSNCAFDENEDYIYATSDMYLIRVKLKN